MNFVSSGLDTLKHNGLWAFRARLRSCVDPAPLLIYFFKALALSPVQTLLKWRSGEFQHIPSSDSHHASLPP